eukprot:jgi/Mesvir1/27137/Mv20807-RA.1
MALLGDDTSLLHCCELLGDSPSNFYCNPCSSAARTLEQAPQIASSTSLLPPYGMAPGYEQDQIREHLQSMIEKELDRRPSQGAHRERKRPSSLSGALTDQSLWSHAVANMDEIRKRLGLNVATMALGAALLREFFISLGDPEIMPTPQGDVLCVASACCLILATKAVETDSCQMSMQRWASAAAAAARNGVFASGGGGDSEGGDDSGDNVFDGATLQRMEKVLVVQLDWNLRHNTGYDFLEPLLIMGGVSDESIRESAASLLHAALFGVEFLRSTPSEVAAAAIMLACEAAGYNRGQLLEVESRMLESVQSHDKASVRECQRMMRIKCQRPSQQFCKEASPVAAEVAFPESFAAPSPVGSECGSNESHLLCNWPHSCSIKGGKRCCALDVPSEGSGEKGDEGEEEKWQEEEGVRRQHKRPRMEGPDSWQGWARDAKSGGSCPSGQPGAQGGGVCAVQLREGYR